MGIATLAGAALFSPTAAAPGPSAEVRTTESGSVIVTFAGLRSHKGMMRACLTRKPAFFPHCDKDPDAQKASVAADGKSQMHFGTVEPGAYALTVLHDENGNMRADMMLGIPREGVGFSRNPVLRMAPPTFEKARFAVPAAPVHEDIKIRYFL